MSSVKVMEPVDRQSPIPAASWLLLAGTAFGKLVYKSAIPFLSLFLLRHDHLTASAIGLVLGVSYLVGAMISLLTGYLTDKVGQSRLMVASLIALAFTIALIPESHQVLLFVTIVLAVGVFRNAFETSNQSLLVRVTPDARRSEVFALRYIVVNFASGVGPLLGAWLGISGQSLSFTINGAGYLLYACLLLASHRTLAKERTLQSAKKEPTSLQAACSDVVHNRPFLFGLLAACLLNYGYTQIDVTLPQVLARHGLVATHWFAYLLAANTLCIVSFQWPVSRLVKPYPKRTTMMIGVFFSALGYWLLGDAHALPAYLFAMLIVSAGEMLSLTLVVPWLADLATPARQGAYFGMARLRFLGDFAGAMAGGALLEHFGARFLFGSTSAIVLLAILGLALAGPRKRASP